MDGWRRGAEEYPPDVYPTAEEHERMIDEATVCCICDQPFDDQDDDLQKCPDDMGNVAHVVCAEDVQAERDLYADSYRDLR